MAVADIGPFFLALVVIKLRLQVHLLAGFVVFGLLTSLAGVPFPFSLQTSSFGLQLGELLAASRPVPCALPLLPKVGEAPVDGRWLLSKHEDERT